MTGSVLRSTIAVLTFVCAFAAGREAAAGGTDEPGLYDGLSLAEAERRFIGTLPTDLPDSSFYSHKLFKKDGYYEILKRRYGCFPSEASGNATRGYTLDSEIYLYQVGSSEDVRVVDERYLIAHGCRLHSCDEKSMTIADLETGRLSLAMLHYFNWEVTGDPSTYEGEYLREGLLTLFAPPGTDEATIHDTVAITRNWIEQQIGSPYFIQKVPPVTVSKVSCDENG